MVQDHDVTHARAVRQRDIDNALRTDRLATTRGSVDGDDGHRPAIVQALCDCVHTEAREHRQHDGADLRHGQHRGSSMRQVGQVHADDVTATDTEAAQAPGEAAGLAVQIGEGPGAHCTVFAFPHQRRLFVALGGAPPVEAVEHHVRHAAHAPVREGGPLGHVQHPFIWTFKSVVEEADQLVVKPVRVQARALVERLEAVDAQRTHEAGQVGPFDHRRVGAPDDAGGSRRIDLHDVQSRQKGEARRWPRLQLNAAMPVIARPRISACTSWVPS